MVMTTNKLFEEDNEFFEALEQSPQDEESLVCLFTGPRGGGKTLTMSVKACQMMLRGYPVWSNYKIEFTDENGKIYQSKPLAKTALYEADVELHDGYLAIMELQLWLHHRMSMTNNNLLISGLFQQIRKRNLTVMGDVQNFAWVDKDFRYGVDIICDCHDAFKEPGGKEAGVKKGTIFWLNWMDISGYATGRPYEFYKIIYKSQLAHAERFWHIYNTKEEAKTIEAFSRVKVHAPTTHIGQVENNAGLIIQVHNALKALLGQGKNLIKAEDLWPYFKSLGIDGNPIKLGRLCKGLGVRYRQVRNGYIYNLETLREDIT